VVGVADVLELRESRGESGGLFIDTIKEGIGRRLRKSRVLKKGVWGGD